jgi:hypothetical protein
MAVEQHDTETQRIVTPLERKLEKIISPFQRFTHDQATGSILLIVCTLTALLVANSTLDAG